MADERDPCVRCGERPPVDPLGYCEQCHWTTAAEVADGFRELSAYLRGWARFRVWERDHPEVAEG